MAYGEPTPHIYRARRRLRPTVLGAPLVDEGYAGKTGSDSAAGGCLAFFTRVTVGGERRTAVGVVMGQGEGSDTGALLGAAGESATRLVGAATSGTGRANFDKPAKEWR